MKRLAREMNKSVLQVLIRRWETASNNVHVKTQTKTRQLFYPVLKMMNRLGRNYRLQSASRTTDRRPSAVLASTPTQNGPRLPLAPQQKLFSISVSALGHFGSSSSYSSSSSSNFSPSSSYSSSSSFFPLILLLTSSSTSSSLPISTFSFNTKLLSVLGRAKQIWIISCVVYAINSFHT